MPTIKELRSLSQSKRRDPIYTFMDYLAYYPAKILLYTSLTPNQITIMWILGQIIAALFLITGDHLIMTLAVLAFQCMFILDCTDGIVARYRKKFSLNGIYLDYLGHYIANPLLLVCYGIGVFKIERNIIFLLLGIGAAIVFLLNKAITLNPSFYSNPVQREKIENALNKSLLKNQNQVLYTIFALFRLEYLGNLMFWGTLFGFAAETLMVYSLFLFLELIRKMVTQFRNNQSLDN